MLNRVFRTPPSWALLPLRIGVGVVFLVHGIQKLQWGNAAVTQYFAKVGIPLASFWAPVVTWVELLCGAALVIGLLTRYAALLLTVEMVVAILKVHLKAGFFISSNDYGYEFALALLGATLTLLFAGGGKPSVDQYRE